MSKITLIVGGVRSGKSRYAVKIAELSGNKVAFLATCEALDDEMEKRIELHKKSRPKNWMLYEETIDIIPIIKNIEKGAVLIIDCLGLWISNLLLRNYEEVEIQKYIESLIYSLSKTEADIIIVSNEVGMGVVPDSYLGRIFRDYLGLANQKIAEMADEVISMQVGIANRIK